MKNTKNIAAILESYSQSLDAMIENDIVSMEFLMELNDALYEIKTELQGPKDYDVASYNAMKSWYN